MTEPTFGRIATLRAAVDALPLITQLGIAEVSRHPNRFPGDPAIYGWRAECERPECGGPQTPWIGSVHSLDWPAVVQEALHHVASEHPAGDVCPACGGSTVGADFAAGIECENRSGIMAYRYASCGHEFVSRATAP